MPRLRQYLLAFVFALAASAAALAQTSDVKVVNPASSPVLTKIVNPASAPVQTKIINPAGAPVQTRIVNPTAAPVPVRIVEESAREPFQKTLSITSSANNSTYTVPANKRLVIQFASAHFFVPVDVKVILVKLTTQLSASSGPLGHFFVSVFQGSKPPNPSLNQFGGDQFAVSQQALIYAGPGTEVKFSFDLSAANTTLRSGSMTITGYLLPVAAEASAAPEADGAEANGEGQNEQP